MPRRKPTQKAIADALGLTQARVSQLHRRGMPINDIGLARAWRDANLDPVGVAASARLRHGEAPTPAAVVADDPAPAGANRDFFAARARREAAEAAKAEIELAALRGQYVDRRGVELASMAASRLLRDRIESTAPRLAGGWAACRSQHEAFVMILSELRTALQSIAEACRNPAEVMRLRAEAEAATGTGPAEANLN